MQEVQLPMLKCGREGCGNVFSPRPKKLTYPKSKAEVKSCPACGGKKFAGHEANETVEVELPTIKCLRCKGLFVPRPRLEFTLPSTTVEVTRCAICHSSLFDKPKRRRRA